MWTHHLSAVRSPRKLLRRLQRLRRTVPSRGLSQMANYTIREKPPTKRVTSSKESSRMADLVAKARWSMLEAYPAPQAVLETMKKQPMMGIGKQEGETDRASCAGLMAPATVERGETTWDTREKWKWQTKTSTSDDSKMINSMDKVASYWPQVWSMRASSVQEYVSL